MSDVIEIRDRSIALSVTIAKFRRPSCSIKRYHVWRWRGGPRPPRELRCQCGLLKAEGLSQDSWDRG